MVVAAALASLPGAENAAGRKSHRRGNQHAQQRIEAERRQKRKKRKKKARPAPVCTPESTAQTCAGHCGQVKDNCGASVDCGSCACGAACPICQSCDATTGRCKTNPGFLDLVCGQPGQVCQADGACVCSSESCADGQRCNGLVCVCDATSCPNGCCDGNICRSGTSRGACAAGGAACQECDGICLNGTCSSCSAEHRCPAGMHCNNGSCVVNCPDCLRSNSQGQCVPDSSVNREVCGPQSSPGVCCSGMCCSGCCNAEQMCGPCVVLATPADHTGELGGLDGADAKCQEYADTDPVSYPGTYRAWLSDSTDSPSTRFRCHAASCSSRGYAKPGRAVRMIASDWADLTDGALSVSISDQGEWVWTNTRPDGTPGGDWEDGHCENWTSSNALNGNVGYDNQVTGEWTVYYHTGCNSEQPLYCVQQS